jgi:hypothetical protein
MAKATDAARMRVIIYMMSMSCPNGRMKGLQVRDEYKILVNRIIKKKETNENILRPRAGDARDKKTSEES